MKKKFTLVVCFALCCFCKAALATQKSPLLCSPYNAVYTPYPSYKRGGDITYTMTIERQKCEDAPCVSAIIRMNTYKSGTFTNQLPMRYYCGGTGVTCGVSISDSGRADNRDIAQFELVALTHDFNRTDFLGSKDGKAAYALILPAIGRKLGYLFNEGKLNKSVNIVNKETDDTLLAFQFVPEVWVINSCKD